MNVPAIPTHPVLALAGATYRYPAVRRPALDGIDLTVGPGEVVGLVGPNEAGKTTLCLVAAGLAPTSIGGKLEGSVQIGGRRTIDLKPYELAQRVGILFQNASTQVSGTVPTVWEEVAFGPRNLGLEMAEIVDRVERALALLRIGPLAARDPSRLSGGQAQLVALASVLALRPACLVLDEPTSQLDPAGTRLVGDALARLAEETSTAILLVEHKTDLLASVATRVVLLVAGKVVADGSSAEILAAPELEENGVEPPSAVRIERLASRRGVGLERDALEVATR
ncbi:MAG TPA: ABC transporter ATP-binding protein [Candidatus Limnocylindrales bacterium]|nr:ABC transporter ATP-binding protein [Candidatus Limnocylindrales bacterium]